MFSGQEREVSCPQTINATDYLVVEWVSKKKNTKGHTTLGLQRFTKYFSLDDSSSMNAYDWFSAWMHRHLSFSTCVHVCPRRASSLGFPSHLVYYLHRYDRGCESSLEKKHLIICTRYEASVSRKCKHIAVTFRHTAKTTAKTHQHRWTAQRIVQSQGHLCKQKHDTM